MLHDIVANPDVQAAVQVLLIALVTAAAGVFTRAVHAEAKATISGRDLDRIEQAARMAVLYAEQTGLKATGEAKLTAAMRAADDILSRYGINVTSQQLRTAIEAAVHNELNSYTDITPLPSAPTPAVLSEKIIGMVTPAVSIGMSPPTGA